MPKIWDRGHLSLISYTALPIAIGVVGARVPQSRDGVPPEPAMSIVRTNIPRADRAGVDSLMRGKLAALGLEYRDGAAED